VAPQSRLHGLTVLMQRQSLPPRARVPMGGARRRPLRRRAWLGVGSVAIVCLGLLGSSVGQALIAPGEDDATARLAEWGRDHGLGAGVTALEALQYRLSPPATGGTPDTTELAQLVDSSPVPVLLGTVMRSGTSAATATGLRAPRHSPLRTPVLPSLPHEGVFVPTGPSAAQTFVQYTYVRPDRVHTSYLAGVAWMSHLDRFVLHPGYQEPGGTSGWSQPDQLSGSHMRGLLATFNSGFKVKDANGGYFDHGKQVGQLVAGAASLVIYKDGHATVGTWGKDVRMGTDVDFVRQNLKPLIEHGSLAKDLNANVQSTWGATIGGDAAVWRSGLGVTSAGDLVYAMGDALSVHDLADILHRAGAVNAMQLDINKAWVSFMYYRGSGTSLQPRKLGSFQRPANRYLQPVSRDFVAVYQPRSA
jgi:hypothetical protein